MCEIVEIRSASLVDVAPTVAHVLGIALSNIDGHPISSVDRWSCRSAILVIVDSLGFDLYKALEKCLCNISRLAAEGILLKADAVSNHTSPSIATILSGLLPENHKIYDKESAKRSSICSIPELASSMGIMSAVVMERNGAEVYDGRIEIIRGISDRLDPANFDHEACLGSLEALAEGTRLLVSYFIGIDKSAHMGLGFDEIKQAALTIDGCIGEIANAAAPNTLMVICGDHPVHAGSMKNDERSNCVALVLCPIKAQSSANLGL